ncbi:hypothetical protein EZY14_017770 [Kordia sp. TARA_039_SRF]|jgi:hypothetical protein|nr:hypothetical protein EZY14_017770 [Kordia sp. TARA_039_SRF]
MKSIFFPKKKRQKVTKKELSYQSFQKLKVTNDLNVYIIFSDTEEEIYVETNEDLHAHVKCNYKNETLSLKKSNSRSLKKNEAINIYIKTKPFYDFYANDDCIITLQSLLKGDEVFVNLDDDSKFVATVEVPNMELTADDDSEVEINGIIDRLKLRLKEDSLFDCFDLSVNHLDAHLSSDSEAKVTVNTSLKMKLNDDSELKYKGNPTIEKKEVWGDSSVVNIPS